MMCETKKREKEKKEGYVEEKIVGTLTDRQLSAVKAMLEKDHAIDCIFLLMLDRGRWKHAKKLMRKLKLTLPDGTFRARMIEIEDVGLAFHENIDTKKKRWVITEPGRQLGELLLKMFCSLAKRR